MAASAAIRVEFRAMGSLLVAALEVFPEALGRVANRAGSLAKENWWGANPAEYSAAADSTAAGQAESVAVAEAVPAVELE